MSRRKGSRENAIDEALLVESMTRVVRAVVDGRAPKPLKAVLESAGITSGDTVPLPDGRHSRGLRRRRGHPRRTASGRWHHAGRNYTTSRPHVKRKR